MTSNIGKTPEPGGSNQVSKSLPEPRFPSPSACSKWLMLYWFAGYPPAKIRSLLSHYYKIENCKDYNVENIEHTFRKLQHNANHNEPDFMKDAYMWHLMKAEGKSPTIFRHSATRWLEKNHPAKALEMSENDEISEMNLWFERWSEEVQLMRKSKVKAYRERAMEFAEKLDSYTNHFGGKKHSAYYEDTSEQIPLQSTSTSGAQATGAVMIPDPEETPRQNIERPKLAVRTKFGVFARKSAKQEGTPTPSTAQHLDEMGFFARRPQKTSPGSIIEARTRTPSLSSSQSEHRIEQVSV